ncbi:MAG: DUF5667 domain-containing protein [Actinomycetota bacterium]|nr:DUF5667 domain-containing protein [Actinomycetota bacterium]
MPVSDADRFAELIDAALPAHPGAPELNGAAGRAPAAEGETRELLAVVSALREIDFDIGPSEQTRWRQRQRLVAMAAVRSNESKELADEEAGRHRALDAAGPTEQVSVWSQALARIRQAQSGRRLIAALAGLSVIVAALGILSLLAQSAIPGDSLYALKRGTEQARLVLAGNERDEGRVLLGFASIRLEEIDALLDAPVSFTATGSGIQAADGGNVSELLVATMDTMDRQTTEGTHLLTTAAVNDGSLPTLQFIGEWGIEQFSVLDDLTSQMPQAARDRAEGSKDLLQRVVQRLEILAEAIECDCPENLTESDELGPLPSSDLSDETEGGSPSASGPTETTADSTTSPSNSSGPAPTTTAEPSSEPAEPSSEPAEPSEPSIPPVPPNPDPNPDPNPVPAPDPDPDPNPIPIPDPIPIPTQSVPPETPAPPPPTDPNEGEPCTLIGFLGIEIPGIWIGGVCVGLGG